MRRECRGHAPRTRRFARAAIAVVVTALQPAAAQTPPATGSRPAPPAATAAHSADEGRPFVRAYEPLGRRRRRPELGASSQDPRGVIYVGSAAGVLEFDGVDVAADRDPGAQHRALAGDRRRRPHLRRQRRRLRLPRARHQGRDALRVAGRPPPGRRRPVRRRLAHARHPRRRRLPERAADLPLGQRPVRGAPAGVALQPGLARGRPGLRDRAGVRPQRSRRRHVPRPCPAPRRLRREHYPVVLRYDDRRLLIGTRSGGLFLYDGTALDAVPDRARRMPQDRVALPRPGAARRRPSRSPTTSAGFVHHRPARAGGSPCSTRRTACRPTRSTTVMADREGAIWTALERGIARVETPSPASFFDESDGFPGRFNGTRHDGRLYLAGQGGVPLPVEPATAAERGAIVPVTGIRNQCWWFETMTDPAGRRPAGAAVACTDGLYESRGNGRGAGSAPGRRHLPRRVAAASRRPIRRGSGWGCSTGWRRSAGWTAAGSTKAASRR